MKKFRGLAELLAGALALILWLVPSAPASAGEMSLGGGGELAPIGGGWTYQGFLANNGAPAAGAHDFQFALFDAPVGGVQAGSTVTVDNLGVANGVFQALLNFGGTGFYADTAKWLEIRVRPGPSGGAYTVLSPRQFVSPAPLALAIPNVHSNQGVDFVGVGRNFRISGNEVFGIRAVTPPNTYGGMYVETSDATGWPFYGYATNGSFHAWTFHKPTPCDATPPCDLTEQPGWKLFDAGIRLAVPTTGGLRVGPSADYSIVVENSTGSDGVRIFDTADDAIQIGSDPDYSNYGVYIPSPGVSTYGLWPNTANAAGEWALFTVDNIQAGNVFSLGQTQIARVDGEEELHPGDVVAAVGYGPALAGHHDDVPKVVAAGALEAEAVIGVVKSRMLLRAHPGKSGEDAGTLESADGPAQPGEFVAVVVRGVTLVRPDAGVDVSRGQRLTVGEIAGQIRPLRSRIIEGMVVSEGLPSLGIALGPNSDEGLVPVYVDVR